MKTKIPIWVLYLSLILILVSYCCEKRYGEPHTDKVRADSLEVVIAKIYNENILIEKLYE